MSNEVLVWEITPSEERKQVRKFILSMWTVLVGLVVFSLFYYVSDFLSWTLREGFKPALNRVLYVVIGVTVCIWLFFLLTKFIPYKLRTYHLDNTGVTISKDKKKKYFSWNEFECFYPYRSYRNFTKKQYNPRESKREEFLKAGEQIEGQIFYLKKKSTNLFSKFYKNFVVVYSESNNSKSVLKFLDRHLSQRKMISSTDLGLVFYQFK